MLWKHEIGELPSHRESRFWLATGLLLPVWDRLPADNMRVRRLATDPGSGEPAPASEPGGQVTGESLIGRVLDAEQVSAVRAGFGLGGGPAMTGLEPSKRSWGAATRSRSPTDGGSRAGA